MTSESALTPTRSSAVAAACFFLAASFAATASFALAPRPGGLRHIAIFAPGWSAERSFAASVAAEVAILGPGKRSNIVYVSAPDVDSRDALRRRGAWLVVDADRLEACFSVFR